MKKVLIAIVLFIVLLGSATAFVYFKYPEKILHLFSFMKPATGVWQYEKTLQQPVTVESSKDKDVMLGNLSTEKISVTVPKGSFDKDTKITLINPSDVPNIVPAEITTIGAPIEITVGQPVRLNDKTIITFGFDKTKLPVDTKGYQLRVAYYNGTKWDYLKPIAVDLNAGTMTFGTYHFSIFGASKLQNDSQVTQAWIHTQAIGNQLNSSNSNISNQMTGQMLKMTMEKMGITDPAVMQNVEENIMQDKNYQKIAATYEQNNNTEAATEIAGIIGTKIAEHVPKVLFTNHTLKESGEFPGDTAAVAKAVGYLTEGNKTEAAKMIGEQIIDKFMIGVAGKIAVILTKTAIANWKDSEIEAAYTAFNSGSNAKFYGYNVDKGDFNAVWDQMRGIRRQLEIEAVDRENEARKEAGLPILTEAQEELVKENLKESYKEQFTVRSEKEADLTGEETKLKAIMDAFDKAGFLGVAPPAGMDKGLELENKLDILSHFAEKMMQDTGRPDISDKTGLLVNGKLSLEDLVQGARFYFAADTDKGKADYAKFLQDRFGINQYPKLSDLAGAYSGNLTITSVVIPDDLKKQAQAGQKDENGCDFSIDPSTLIGKSNPVSFSIQPTGDTAGTMIFNSLGSSGQTVPFTYTDGIISATFTQKGATVTISLTMSKDNQNYTASGSLNAIYAEGKVKLSANLSATKAITPAASSTGSPETTSTTTP